MSSQQKRKNNHFVPRSYLQRFCPASGRQIALYNIKSNRVVPQAPIKSQCSRDYFYTQNPIFEEKFGDFETDQKILLGEIIESGCPPSHGSVHHSRLLSGIMFQAGRTASAVVQTDHIANEFGKAMLRHHLEKEGHADLLEHLPRLEISVTNAVMDSIGQHLAMYPLIGDLDCTLFVNKTAEDFLTSDHPVALCNSMLASHASERALGFASRGLIIVYPISPRALLFLSDTEVYKVDRDACGMSVAHRKRDVIELNLAQFGNAFENVYFPDPERVRETLDAFRRRSTVVRPPRPTLTEKPFVSADSRRGVLLHRELSG